MQMADYDCVFVKWRALTNLFIYGMTDSESEGPEP
jgi:hypothetical protein